MSASGEGPQEVGSRDILPTSPGRGDEQPGLKFPDILNRETPFVLPESHSNTIDKAAYLAAGQGGADK